MFEYRSSFVGDTLQVGHGQSKCFDALKNIGDVSTDVDVFRLAAQQERMLQEFGILGTLSRLLLHTESRKEKKRQLWLQSSMNSSRTSRVGKMIAINKDNEAILYPSPQKRLMLPIYIWPKRRDKEIVKTRRFEVCSQ